MLVGYARVSSIGQSLEVQMEKLRHYERVYAEKRSGTSEQRPELRACLDFVREGDIRAGITVVRLPRSLLPRCAIAEGGEHTGVHLAVLAHRPIALPGPYCRDRRDTPVSRATPRKIGKPSRALCPFCTAGRRVNMNVETQPAAKNTPRSHCKILSVTLFSSHARNQEFTMRVMRRTSEIKDITTYPCISLTSTGHAALHSRLV